MKTNSRQTSFIAPDMVEHRGAILTEESRFLAVRTVVISLCKSIRLRNINRNSRNSGGKLHITME